MIELYSERMTNNTRDIKVPEGASFQHELLACIPALRCRALALCRDASIAEDLTQDALEAALSMKSHYTLGTNLGAWVFTIMRHIYSNQLRKQRRRRRIEAEADIATSELSHADQEIGLVLNETLIHIGAMHPAAIETFSMIVIDGMSYADAARKIAVPVGTVRSRVSRVRRIILNAFQEDKNGVSA